MARLASRRPLRKPYRPVDSVGSKMMMVDAPVGTKALSNGFGQMDVLTCRCGYVLCCCNTKFAQLQRPLTVASKQVIDKTPSRPALLASVSKPPAPSKYEKDAAEIYENVRKSAPTGHWFHHIPGHKVIALITQKLEASGGAQMKWKHGELEALLQSHARGAVERCRSCGHQSVLRGLVCADEQSCYERYTRNITQMPPNESLAQSRAALHLAKMAGVG